jgi:Carboxypeptidase regulatory-like domain
MREILLLVLMSMVLLTSSPCSEQKSSVAVSGTVVLAEDSSPISGATVWFQRSDGMKIKSITDSDGKYEASIQPGYEYTMTVGGRGICSVHRPDFSPDRAHRLKFNFLTTNCGTFDGVIISSPGVTPNDNRPYYRYYNHTSSPMWFFEESINAGKYSDQELLLAFGQRTTNETVRYGPFRMPDHIAGSTQKMPVIVSFGTYTIRADTVLVDPRSNILEAEGHVLLANAVSASAKTVSCIEIKLKSQLLRPEPCN